MLALLLIFWLIVKTPHADQTYCPSLCNCKGSRSSDGPNESEWLKLRCGSSENPISDLKDINLERVSNSVVNLNLSGNAISILSRELNLPVLQKLDLSKNQISLIESDAFYNLIGLQRLDISSNQIKHVSKEIFKGLVKLERLILSQNKISSIVSGTFDLLYGLHQLDISENPLECDCNLLWLADWSRTNNVKLIGNPKCSTPEELLGINIRKLRQSIDLSKCRSVLGSALDTLVLRPNAPQVVFSGDSMHLKCRAPFLSLDSNYTMSWITPNSSDNILARSLTNEDVVRGALAENVLVIPSLSNNHSGNWTCIYLHEDSTELRETVELLVISNDTRYCAASESIDNRGYYAWPRTMVNHRGSQPCAVSELGNYFSVTRMCNESGEWVNLNSTNCPYISETTRMLQQFARLNLTSMKSSALSASQRLKALVQQNVPPKGLLTDPDEVNFISQAVFNYIHHLDRENELGSVLLDIISYTMTLPEAVLKVAESLYNCSSSMHEAVEIISKYISNVEGHKSNIVTERFAVKRESFTGVTCMWFSNSDDEDGISKQLHCSTSNKNITPLLSVRDKFIHASIQIPPTLLYRVDHAFTSDNPSDLLSKVYDLVVSMYQDSSFFPTLPLRSKNDTDNHPPYGLWNLHSGNTKNTRSTAITSPVVGVKLVNVTMQHPLAEPVYVMVRDVGIATGIDGRAAIWDENKRIWNSTNDGCSVSHIITNMVVIQCYRLGYIGLLQNVEIGIYGGRTAGARFRVSHPAIYVGSLILVICLMCATLSYMLCYSAIQMAKRVKHSLINTWIGMSLLCFMYTLGIYQTEEIKLCQAIGISIHYLTLSCLLWMTVSASHMYKCLSKAQRSTVRSPDEELSPDLPIQKPILGLYLVGWGIALIVCGISGAVNMKEYASYSQCFLSNPPSLSAVFVPAGILISFLTILYLLVRCTIRNVNGQLSEGTQATENVDLDTWEPNLLTNENADRRSERSIPESEIEDSEHTPIVQLRAQIIVLCVYLALWTCGAVAVYRPFPLYLPYQEDIFSILYALCATVLGTFILFFYGIARSDVRSQWLVMHCYLRKRKQCCRNRSVFEANPSIRPVGHNALMPIANQLASSVRSRSSSQNSNRTNSKSNNSNNMKVGAELNGQSLRRDSVRNSKKIANINLVVLHRQQYRSNNSITTFPENGGSSTDMFYNPNQINVARKFFKKQRQQIKRNCLDLPQRRDCDTDSQVSSAPAMNRHRYDGVASLLTAGSKVNNTNLHFEKAQLSDGGIKETRNCINPNIMPEEDNIEKPQNKCYIFENGAKNNATAGNVAKVNNRSPVVMNIYTNVPETAMPQHQVVSPEDVAERPDVGIQRPFSVSAEFLSDRLQKEAPEMRTVSQQCSLEYSSNSEVAVPLNRTYSDQTLNTHSEITSLQETRSALCSTNEIARDVDSFGTFMEYLQLKPTTGKIQSDVRGSQSYSDADEICLGNHKKKIMSFEELSKDCTQNRDLERSCSTPCVFDGDGSTEFDKLIEAKSANNARTANATMVTLRNEPIQRFGSGGMNTSESNFENGSDIYFPNYQMSELSIRSHGLYAPSPTSICQNELSISLSHEDLTHNENQYVNFNPAWRKSSSDNSRFQFNPATYTENVEENGSPVSFASEIDELYTQITSRENEQTLRRNDKALIEAVSTSDMTFKACETAGRLNESTSDVVREEFKLESTV